MKIYKPSSNTMILGKLIQELAKQECHLNTPIYAYQEGQAKPFLKKSISSQMINECDGIVFPALLVGVEQD